MTTEFRVSWTGDQVIVDHARCLHQRVADGRAHELKSASKQIAAHRIGFCRARGHLRHAAPPVLPRFASHKAPEVTVETPHFFSERKKRLRILDRSGDLEPISHDPGVAQQPPHITRAVASDLLCAEPVERSLIVFPFLQNRDPAQPCLGAFEDQEFEEHPIIVQRHTPFVIVVGDGGLYRSPRTTRHAPTMPDSNYC